jgi:hypothetical protein
MVITFIIATLTNCINTLSGWLSAVQAYVKDNKQMTIKLSIMQVGNGRPRLTLMSLDDLSLEGI